MSATITAAQAVELYADGEGESGDTSGNWTLAVDVEDAPHSRTSRWHEKYWLVVRNADGATYGIEYGVGLTENQEDDLPWARGSDDRELSLTRLYPHTVTKVVYSTKPERGEA